MNVMQLLSSQPWVERLGWTLVHFLWQGTLIAALYAAARRAARAAAPNARYLLACGALLSMLAAPLATWRAMQPAPPQPLHAAAPSRTAAMMVIPDGFKVPAESAAARPPVWPDRYLPYVVAVWLAGALACWMRLMGGWVVAARMRSLLVRPAPARWQTTLRELGARIGVSRPVHLLVSAMVQVPTVVGWLRPVVLVPVGALAGLPAEQVEALLVHELAHIRRHDYLVNVLQGVAEALLFYHPAVWWVSGHIRAERELCCDDIAVAISGDVLTYANALVELESFRPAHASAVLAANHGSLAERVGRLLGESRPAARMHSGPAIAASGILLLATAWGVFAQGDTPRFEVASIKPHAQDGATFFRGMRPLPGGRLTATNVPVRMLIGNAYDIQSYQIVGGPRWMETDGFDIEAKGDSNATRQQVLVMARGLLEDRFQLRFHRETRDLPVYALTVAKSGSKLSPPKEGGCVEFDQNSRLPAVPSPGAAVVPCGSPVISMAPGGSTIAGGKVPMNEFVRILQIVLNQPVLDRTGITERFDVQLKFMRDDVTGGLPAPIGGGGPAPGVPPPAVSPEDAPPPILSAVQEQLGLKLEKTKGPVEVLVIDRLEKPTAN